MTLQEVIRFIQAAMECSVYIAPTEPGLTYEEIVEACAAAGFKAGEINDAFQRSNCRSVGSRRLVPSLNSMITSWKVFAFREEPEYRNFAALDFVYSQLNESVRTDGAAKARIERATMLNRAIAQQIPRNDIEAAITISIFGEFLIEENGVLRFAAGTQHMLPSQHQSQPGLTQQQPRRELT
jgi:hypothetical protein